MDSLLRIIQKLRQRRGTSNNSNNNSSNSNNIKKHQKKKKIERRKRRLNDLEVVKVEWRGSSLEDLITGENKPI